MEENTEKIKELLNKAINLEPKWYRPYLIISRVFNIDISLVNNNSSPKTIDAWDSMNMYVLINEVETEFGIKFSLDEILEIQNVQNIENLLVKHGCENK